MAQFSMEIICLTGSVLRGNQQAMFTEAAKYDAKSARAVGLLISGDGEFIQLDWCHIDHPWAKDERIEDLLMNNLFRPVTERMVDSMFFRDD